MDIWDQLRAENPWKDLPSTAPYVLPQDRAAVEQLNRRRSGRNTELQTDIIPEPFVGSPSAPLWLLSLNPGFTPEDRNHGEHIRELQRQAIWLHGTSFWFIDPNAAGIPGHEWWHKRTRALQQEFGHKKVREGIFCVELFPYHSRRYGSGRVSSQEFTFRVVREGIRQGKSFIFMRSRRLWLEAVPELARARYASLRNFQSPYVTRRNLDDQGILDALT